MYLRYLSITVLPPGEGLTLTPVGSYKEIEGRIEEGTLNRTVASTQMNATSSRAHTIVGINFVQKFKNAAGEDTTKGAVVNLVDLAGRLVYHYANILLVLLICSLCYLLRADCSLSKVRFKLKLRYQYN